MKALSSESPRPRTKRRISKPQMEKRRRERINHSLETLRLLMLENTHDENMKNPKVGKAEILESVVHFLRTEKEVEKGHSAMKEERSTCASQHTYREGMRSCLLRVSHFIASKSKELMEIGGEAVQTSLTEPQTQPSYPGHIHMTQKMPSPAADSVTLSPQPLLHHHHQHAITRPYLTSMTGLHCDTQELFSSTAATVHITDPVWRPWPQ